jgi:hypothetical protein
MVYEKNGSSLVPFDFEQILERMPELNRFGYQLTVISFNKLIDSANVNPAHWAALAMLIQENYDKYNGFVIIHGTDTMAYSASALGYLLEGLNKMGGNPQVIYSDDEPSFTTKEFQELLEERKIKHIITRGHAAVAEATISTKKYD